MTLTLRRASLMLAANAAVFGAGAPLRAQAPPPAVASTRGLVVSVSAPASDIGASILARGGNAVDAAVATAFALAVTHPSAGNLGGGGFMIIRLPDGTATTIDYREKAPLASTPTMYLNADGTIDRAATRAGWRAPGVPGTVRGLELAHAKYGKLPWATIVQPAAALARNGWPLSEALARSINGALRGKTGEFESSRAAYGKHGGGDWQPGDTIRLPDLAHTLGDIAAMGPDVFYTGWVADSIDAQMRANGGLITKADLRHYEAIERAPVRGTFLGNDIIAMGPPSSGGAVIVETLNILEHVSIQDLTPGSANYLHARIEAARLAYLDRARFLGDSDFVRVPLGRLLSKAYADTLAGMIDPAYALSSVEIGADIVSGGAGPAEPEETTHFSVVDADGMAVSNTYTIEGGFGSGVVVAGAGFLLNNEMGDFNKKAGETNTRGDIGTPPNMIAPGKRMLSSMSPVIVARDGKLLLVTGSPGGRTIPNTVIDVMLGVLAFDRDIRDAVDAPRMHNQWLPDTTRIEAGGATAAVLNTLRARGQRIGMSENRSQGDAHSIFYDAESGTAYGANDTRSPDSKASTPEPQILEPQI